MRINPVRAMIISSLIIIILYILGLFLPIIKNTKHSEIYDLFEKKDKVLLVKMQFKNII